MEMNSMGLTDWYKVGHPGQYHPNTQNVYSNQTARGSRIPGVNYLVVAGIQSFIKIYLIEHFNKNFFSKPEDVVIAEYSRRVRTSLGSDLQPLKNKFYQKNYPNDPYGHIRHLHRHGRIPLTIKALPEGSKVPMRVPYVTITNDRKKYPEFYWLTNFIETIMSASTWQMCTSATLANEYRLLFEKYAMETVGNTDFVPFQGHDFSFRGMSSLETACYSGAGHLLSFVGTDTIPAIDFLEMYYNANAEKELVGCSVNATEHAVMCSNTGFYVWDSANGDWDRIGDCEFEVFKYLITELYPTGIVSIVSDTWDLWRVIIDYMRRLKDLVMSRDGKVVLRPDSGNPVDILCGDYGFSSNENDELQYTENKNVTDPSAKGVVELLWDIYGGTITEKGYKLLDSHVGTIYGDSITKQRANDICERLKLKGFASINWVAGIGSFTYQYNTRDTFSIATKATYCEAVSTDGLRYFEIPIFKDPITDNGTKKSARGLLRVDEVTKVDENGKEYTTYELTDQVSWEEEAKGALITIFDDGVLLVDWTLQEIRDRIRK